MFIHLLVHMMVLSTAFAATIPVSSYALVPSTAAGPPVPTPPSYRLEDFGGGAYMVTDGLYQAAFFVSDESVIAVDAPPTIGENLVHAIESVTSNPVSHVVYSHHHADHIGGAYLYGSAANNVTFVAHQFTAETLALVPENTRPPPTITFDSTYNLTVGNQTLELAYRGNNHDPGSIFIYSPAQKVLVLIDIVYPGWTPFNALGEVEFVPGYIKAHEYLLAYDFDHYIGGHLDRSGTRQDVLVAQAYLQDLFETSQRAINMSAQASGNLSMSSVIAPAVLKPNPNNDWALFNTYVDVLADWVTAELAPRWNERLYGTDVYGKSHAMTMLEAVRIDFGMLGPFGVTNA